jgi:hypothetical protein
MAFSAFGKPKYGGNSFAKNIKPKEGAALVVRILPPIKSLAESGEWAIYHGIHYGYKGVNPRDPNKPIFKTFRCIEERDFKTKMVKQDCPECDLIKHWEDELETILANAKKDGLTKEDTEEMASAHRAWLKEHNCDRKWHMNVKQENGEFAVLTLSHKTKKNILEPLIQKLLTDEGIDALEPEQGVWFRITRTGKQIEAVDHIEAVEEAVKDPTTGRISKTTKLAPLTEADEQKALKECPDLATSVTVITYNQIKALTESSGEPESVDAIFALGQKKESSAGNRHAQPSTQRVQKQEEPKPEPKVEPKVEAKAESKSAGAGGTGGPSVAELQAMMMQLQAQLAAATAPKTETQEPAPAPKSEEPKVEPKVDPTPSSTGGAVDRAAFMAKFRQAKPAA